MDGDEDDDSEVVGRAKMLMVLGDDDADDENNVGGLLLPACHCLLPKTRLRRRVELRGRKTYRVSQKTDFLKILEKNLSIQGVPKM